MVRTIIFCFLVCFSLESLGMVLCKHVARDGTTEAFERIYSEGESGLSQIVYLSKSQLRLAARKNKLNPDNIIVVDEFPLEIDPPVVAGVVILKKLKSVHNHVTLFYEKERTPLVHVRVSKAELQRRFKPGSRVNMKVEKESVRLETSEGNYHFRFPKKLRYPLYPEKTQLQAKINWFNRELESKFEMGEKFWELARVDQLLYMNSRWTFNPNKLQKLSINNDYWRKFSVDANYNGQRLKDFVQAKLSELENYNSTSFEKIRENLNEIQNAIREAKAEEKYDLSENNEVIAGRAGYFEILLQKLGRMFPQADALSIRSNNPIEDLISSGLFESTKSAFDKKHFEDSIRKIWASMYSFESYIVHRKRGLGLENISMPILVHPYVESNSSAIVRLSRIKGPQEELKVELSVAEGRGNLVTNPEGRVSEKEFRLNEDGINSSLDNIMSPANAKSLNQMLEHMFPVINGYLRSKEYVYRPDSIELELVWDMDSRTHLLQLKRNFNSELRTSVLEGSVPYELTYLTKKEFDAKKLKKEVKPQVLPKQTKEIQEFLSQIGVSSLESAVSKGHFDGPGKHRIGVIRIGKMDKIVMINGPYHQQVIDALNALKPDYPSLEAQWVASAYLKRESDNSLQIYHSGGKGRFTEEDNRSLYFSVLRVLRNKSDIKMYEYFKQFTKFNVHQSTYSDSY